MKKCGLFILIIMMALVLVSCGKLEIADTNGEANYELCQLNEDDLLKKSPKYFVKNCTTTNNNEKATFEVALMSGVKSVFTYNAKKDDTRNFTVKSEVFEGNVKIFVCNKGKIIYDVPINSDVNVKIASVEGKVEFRVAGESAKLKLEIIK